MKPLSSAAATGALIALMLTGCANQGQFVVGAPVEVGGYGMVADGDSILVVATQTQQGEALRVDAAGNVTTLGKRVVGPEHPVLAFGSLWVVCRTKPWRGLAITRLDPVTGKVQAEVQIPSLNFDGDYDLVATDIDVWAYGSTDKPRPDGSVWRIDPTSNKVTNHIVVLDKEISDATFDGTYVWVVAPLGRVFGRSYDQVRLARIDPASGEVVKYPNAIPREMPETYKVAVAGGRVWVAADPSDPAIDPGSVLLAFDTDGKVVQTLEMGEVISGLLATSDGLWVSDHCRATVTLLDPRDGSRIAGPIKVGRPCSEGGLFDWWSGYNQPSAPGQMVQAGDTVWVILNGDNVILPIRPSDQP